MQEKTIQGNCTRRHKHIEDRSCMKNAKDAQTKNKWKTNLLKINTQKQHSTTVQHDKHDQQRTRIIQSQDNNTTGDAHRQTSGHNSLTPMTHTLHLRQSVWTHMKL